MKESQTERKHTQLPWKSSGMSLWQAPPTVGPELAIIANFTTGKDYRENIANAKFAELAANSYYELVAALRPFADFACDPPCGCHNCIARAAIAKPTTTPKQPEPTPT